VPRPENETGSGGAVASETWIRRREIPSAPLHRWMMMMMMMMMMMIMTRTDEDDARFFAIQDVESLTHYWRTSRHLFGVYGASTATSRQFRPRASGPSEGYLAGSVKYPLARVKRKSQRPRRDGEDSSHPRTFASLRQTLSVTRWGPSRAGPYADPRMISSRSSLLPTAFGYNRE